jgi:hypothetical protein
MKRTRTVSALCALFALARALQAAPPAAGPGIDETARFLAGISAAPGSPLEPFNAEAHWVDHARFFDLAWAKLDARRLQRIRLWEAGTIHASLPVMYYMFSGPDYLYADAFFPNAKTYILCGTEPVGGVPDVLHTTAATLPPVLKNLETSLYSVLNFGYFITKDMRKDLQNQEASGTVPLLMIFLARSHKHILDASYISLDGGGGVHPGGGKGAIQGIRFTFKSEQGGPVKTLYYFKTDISNSGIHGTPGFLKFCQGFGVGDSLLKSASYLLHIGEFSDIRNFLLNRSQTILEDDSGIPISYFTPDKWTLRVFGNYVGPIGLFKQNYQPQLEELFQKSNPAPLNFGMGYRWDTTHTSLILAIRR